MITDKIQLAGLASYFKDPNSPGSVNLTGPVSVRTLPLSKNKQVEINGLQLLIEGNDLSPLFQFQSTAPLFSISVVKEMFAGLFADPFRHRVYNIAGYLDFNEGSLQNGSVMEVDGIPTIVSSGKDECKWISRVYVLPDPVNLDSVAWELATSKLSLADSFTYKIDIECKDSGGNVLGVISSGANFINADIPRFKTQVVNNVNSFQIIFRALVNQDSYITERQLPALNEKMGRPLLRAINILELLNSSVYDIYSLTELQNNCRDFKIFETSAPVVPRITATLDISAVLVKSEREDIPNLQYEFIELNLKTNNFTRFEAKPFSSILIKSNLF